jgi:hypothetical protein
MKSSILWVLFLISASGIFAQEQISDLFGGGFIFCSAHNV